MRRQLRHILDRAIREAGRSRKSLRLRIPSASIAESLLCLGWRVAMPELIKDDRPLAMKVDLTIVEHLGLNMYTTLPPVVSELVANAWDADAINVWITLPNGPIDDKSEIVIRDDGVGMTYQEILDKYLFVARNRRMKKTEKGKISRPRG